MGKLAGVVLAGGASRRMGRDKAQLQAKAGALNGQKLPQIIAGKLTAAGCAPVLLSGKGGVADVYTGKGPLAGIHAAMVHLMSAENMTPERLIIVPVDMPNLSVQSLQVLSQTPGEAAHFERHVFPLTIRITTKIIKQLNVILKTQNTDLSVQAFVKSLAAKAVPMGAIAAEEFINLNTPGDWSAWQKRVVGA